jgi:leader peptidase (prepilin peptidase)/N-methyltransferase
MRVSEWLLLSTDFFYVHLVVVFLYGALMGSFFNVCIYRLPQGQSVNRPRRSFCPACGTMIAWYDNLPLVSYVALGGLCRHCGGPISSRYFAIELLTAVLFSAVFWVHRYTLATPLLWALTAFLIVAMFTDLDHWIIPDSISLGGAAVGVAAAVTISAALAAGWLSWDNSVYVSYPFARLGVWGVAANAVVGAAFGYLLLWTIGVLGTLAFRKEAMGMGDMKLFACIGAFLGWQGCLLVLALASFLGATIGLSLMTAQWICAKLGVGSTGEATASVPAPDAGSSDDDSAPPASQDIAPRRRSHRQLHHLPFGPYIAVAGYVVGMFQIPIVKWLATHFFFMELLP